MPKREIIQTGSHVGLISKLPKWAADEIHRLDAQVASLQDQIRSAALEVQVDDLIFFKDDQRDGLDWWVWQPKMGQWMCFSSTDDPLKMANLAKGPTSLFVGFDKGVRQLVKRFGVGQ